LLPEAGSVLAILDLPRTGLSQRPSMSKIRHMQEKRGYHYRLFVPDNDVCLDEAVATLCNRVESLALGSRTGVCMASPDRTVLSRAVFPNLPATFQACIKNIPMAPPYFGSCTAAMDGGEIITIHDMTKESRFDERFVAVCLQHGIQSLQSRPVYGPDGCAIGTFVMGFSSARSVTDYDEALMQFAADAVGTLFQRRLDERDL
jgi:GAF domain-containing protein